MLNGWTATPSTATKLIVHVASILTYEDSIRFYMKRSCSTKEHQKWSSGRRSFFKELADPDKLDEVKNQFSFESSDDSPEAVRENFKKSKLKRVTRIIDVSDGI